MKNLSNIEHELDIVTKQYVDNAADTKVDKIEGKQLSTNDFSNEDKEKLNSLENYILPMASADALGGIKVGENLTIAEDGTLNAQTGAEDIIIPYKTFTDYSDEEKTSIANKLLNCINSVKSLTKVCYLEIMGVYYSLSGIVNSENNIDFIFIILEGFTQGQITYTVSTTSNTLINVTLNTSNLVDSDMSDTSTNLVQNKVIKSYVDNSIENLVNVGNIDWDETTPNTKGYIANKPFGRVNTFANTTNILFENTTHTGSISLNRAVFNIDFPSGFAENIENITTATLQYNSKTYNIKTTYSATLKRTCTENKSYSKRLTYAGKFNTESIVFSLELNKTVKRTDGTTTLQGKLTCDIRDLIASGIISEIPEDQTVNLTFGLQVTTTGTEIKVIDSAYLPIASADTLGAIKVGNNLTIDENGVLSGNNVDLTSYAQKSELPTKVSDLTNDSLFITNTVNNLTNYYTKTETYTQEQINDLISAAAGLKLEVVSDLPTTDISTSTIYLKGTETEGTNDYEEWIYVNNNWELIGTTAVDLTNYATKEYVDNNIANNVLTKTNTTEFTPTADYHPATKKYVDNRKALFVNITADNTAESGYVLDTSLSEISRAFVIEKRQVYIVLEPSYGAHSPIFEVPLVRIYSPDSSTQKFYFYQDINGWICSISAVLTSDGTEELKVNWGTTYNIDMSADFYELNFSVENWSTIYQYFVNKGIASNYMHVVVKLPYYVKYTPTDGESIQFDNFSNKLVLLEKTASGNYINFRFTLNELEYASTAQRRSLMFTYNKRFKTLTYLEEEIPMVTFNNTTEFTPTSDYNLATKKYVDDSIVNINISNTLSNTAINNIANDVFGGGINV